MGKTVKRNDFHRQKKHGKTFEKRRDKWQPKRVPPPIEEPLDPSALPTYEDNT